MLEKIYEQLGTPKTIAELEERLKEIGIKWNKAQIQLFLEMDQLVEKKGDKWQVKGEDVTEFILNIIDRTLGDRPIITVKKIMNAIPDHIPISELEVLKIALNSGQYVSPNRVAIKRKN